MLSIITDLHKQYSLVAQHNYHSIVILQQQLGHLRKVSISYVKKSVKTRSFNGYRQDFSSWNVTVGYM